MDDVVRAAQVIPAGAVVSVMARRDTEVTTTWWLERLFLSNDRLRQSDFQLPKVSTS